MRRAAASAFTPLMERLLPLSLDHPVRVAIDGRTASGKTTFADGLADALRTQPRDIIRTSIDGFHRPKSQRYARGRFSAEGYYHDARDCEAIGRLLLDPLGPQGNRHYKLASFDLERDEPVDAPLIEAGRDAILIVDGTFLQRPELASAWDFVVFLDVPEADAAPRGIARDQKLMQDEARARDLYELRYIPAFALYEHACAPAEAANCRAEPDDDSGWTYDFRNTRSLGGAASATYRVASNTTDQT